MISKVIEAYGDDQDGALAELKRLTGLRQTRPVTLAERQAEV